MTTIFVLTIVALLALAVCGYLCSPSKSEIPRPLITSQGGWVQIAIAAIGAIASARQQRQQGKDTSKRTIEETRAEAEEQRRNTAYEAALADYYQQQSNDRARKSLGNFARWSSVAPPETPYYSPTVPTMPNPVGYSPTTPGTGTGNPGNVRGRG